MAKNLGLVNKNTKSLAGNVSQLKNVFVGYFAALQFRDLIRVSDSIQLLNDRIEVLSGGVGKSREILEELNGVSERTKVSIETSAETYARLAAAVDTTKVSNESLIALTEALQNSFRLAGASATETSNTIIQLGQAFASGELRGQELRSVMEQNATLAKLLRERFGNDIYKKAEQGSIDLVSVLTVLRNNLASINERAAKLAPTIEQSVTVAFNGLKLSILDINKELDISGKFAIGLEFIIEKLGLLLGIIPVLALTQLPALAFAIGKVAGALTALTLSNPFTAVLYGLSAAAVIVIGNLDRLVLALKNVAYFATIGIARLADFIDSFAQYVGGGENPVSRFFNTIQESISGVANKIESSALIQIEKLSKQEIDPNERNRKQIEDLDKAIASLGRNAKAGKAPKLKDILGDLNKEFLKTKDIETYTAKLLDFQKYKINKEFQEGKIDLLQYNMALEELARNDFDKKLRSGSISLEEFNRSIEESKIRDLKSQLDFGKISLEEFESKLNSVSTNFDGNRSLRVGVRNYIESVGTLSEQVSGAIKNTFSSLEDAFVEFTKNGKFNFKDFANSVLEDLQRIIIRAAIIQPIANGILNSYSTTPSSPTAGTTNGYVGGSTATPGFAKGGVFEGGIKKFASGGVVSSPTLFNYGSKTGLMGEAGPEAILPLSKSSSGQLGVQASVTPVNINIINNAGAQVETQETSGPNGERQIQVLIQRSVDEAIATGKFDKSMRNSYGLQRKGI